MSFLRGLAKQVEKVATAELKISPRNLLLLTEFRRITNIADKANKIKERLTAFGNAKTKAEDFFNGKKSLSNDFVNINSTLQLIAKIKDMLNFVNDLTEASKGIVPLLTDISKIENDCKVLLDELAVIYSNIKNPSKILETAPNEIYQLAKDFAKEIISGGFESKTLQQFATVEATVKELDKTAKEMNEKTKLLQTGYDELVSLIKGKVNTAESDKTNQATTFVSAASNVSGNIEKIPSALSEFKL